MASVEEVSLHSWSLKTQDAAAGQASIIWKSEWKKWLRRHPCEALLRVGEATEYKKVRVWGAWQDVCSPSWLKLGEWVYQDFSLPSLPLWFYAAQSKGPVFRTCSCTWVTSGYVTSFTGPGHVAEGLVFVSQIFSLSNSTHACTHKFSTDLPTHLRTLTVHKYFWQDSSIKRRILSQH